MKDEVRNLSFKVCAGDKKKNPESQTTNLKTIL